jgi:hypothetical protein
MNKIVRIIITVILITTVINLTGCSRGKESDTFAIETKLGDSLIAEVSLSGNMHHCFLHYYITGSGYEGGASFTVRDITIWYDEIPKEVPEYIKEIGSFGKTNFYKIDYTGYYNSSTGKHDEEYVAFFVYDDKYVGYLNKHVPQNTTNSYFDAREHEINCLAIEDLLKSGNFIYIKDYAEVLAFYQNDNLFDLLNRYAKGEFINEELEINKNCLITKEEISRWAERLLQQYYSNY